jgi:twitching motility protein PilT
MILAARWGFAKCLEMQPKTFSLKLGRQMPVESIGSPDIEVVVQPPPLPPPPPSKESFQQFASVSVLDLNAKQILAELVELNARERISDLQIQSSRYVYANKAGSTAPILRWGILKEKTVFHMVEILYAARRLSLGALQSEETQQVTVAQALGADRKLDFASEGDGSGPLGFGRFRIQVHLSNKGIGMTIRILGNSIASLDQLGLPPDVVESLRQKVTKKQGIGLIVGPTGSGKTTTLAGLLDWVRRTHHKHIVTVEDPIEYCYQDTVEVEGSERPAPALVTQQEVGHHVRSFHQGLMDALRKKPDIILVGEIRDAETLRTALEAAETGHFILSTLHTRGAGKTLGRMRQMFNLEQARSILQQFADVGSFIMSQGLIPDVQGRYTLCCEYFSIQEIEDRNAIRKYVDGAFQDVEERLNKPYNRRWNNELKALLAARRITDAAYEQFYQVTGLENK